MHYVRTNERYPFRRTNFVIPSVHKKVSTKLQQQKVNFEQTIINHIKIVIFKPFGEIEGKIYNKKSNQAQNFSKRSFSIIMVCPSVCSGLLFLLIQVCQNFPIDFKLYMVIPVVVWYDLKSIATLYNRYQNVRTSI